MATFHPFPRLPVELRHRIWDMSLQAREVTVHPVYGPNVVKYYSSSAKPPSVLHACRESRLYLQASYVQAFREGSEPRYLWVYFELDTIRISQGKLLSICTQWDSIRQLAIECTDYNAFMDYEIEDIQALATTGLRSLTIINMRDTPRTDPNWWQDWTEPFMVDCYYRCDPLPFFTRVIAPGDPNKAEVNSETYIGQYREFRKTLEETGEYYVDPSDGASEDGRERSFPEWQHTESCNCSRK
ncbi:hypothetical protein PFICI_06739 [Pestalotiopsis fici W106-1]|uniref:2EXR domain-containing protein n=1 Tax=Pestalotiopsis fici (strain W106-1 / CGMCC3.15140) TaxID=1229662 RepID=W3X8M7_PESFW|nr:uncharacterized protein PFICI_06739 [Pestalotiopsis fici W106-1]ETS81737.1 hypothetical protein PFICI_06739 [Pestalotiopsis fici W106-1]